MSEQQTPSPKPESRLSLQLTIEGPIAGDIDIHVALFDDGKPLKEWDVKREEDLFPMAMFSASEFLRKVATDYANGIIALALKTEVET